MMLNLTSSKLIERLRYYARSSEENCISLRFTIDDETNQPVKAVLELEHLNGDIDDLWVWDDFDQKETADA